MLTLSLLSEDTVYIHLVLIKLISGIYVGGVLLSAVQMTSLSDLGFPAP